MKIYQNFLKLILYLVAEHQHVLHWVEEAVLVETAEPIHADSADEEDAIEVRSISEDGFGPAEYVESGDEADRGEVELEAVNPHVVLRERGGGQLHGQVITINMDTTSSVI